MLVPPLQTGPREAVAVYFDSTNYTFTGPWLWQGGRGPSFDPAGLQPPQTAAYPAAFNGALPTTQIPVGQRNAGVAQNLAAAAFEFKSVTTGNPIAYGNNRRVPYWVTFAGTDGRTYSFFVIHGPAGNNPARTYLADLADVAEIVGAVADNEVRLVLGDFNYNLLDNQLVQVAEYTPLINAGYTLGFKSPATPPPPPAQFNGYRGYFATHVRTIDTASYWYIATWADFYPCYGYSGGTTATSNYSLDNILARFGNIPNTNNPCGTLEHVTALNGVVGVPYGVANPPPAGAPPGYYRFAMQMATVADFGNPPAQIMHMTAQEIAARRTSFQQWNNYGHIRSTSDHLAIVADV
jgi:hypothetical protein